MSNGHENSNECLLPPSRLDGSSAAQNSNRNTATLCESATVPVLRELRMLRFTRSLVTVLTELGNGEKYDCREKTLAEANDLLDSWLLSFQMDYSDKMDPDFPVYPLNLNEEDSVNEKLIDECLEKRFSLDKSNATEIFRTLKEKVEKFKEEDIKKDNKELVKVEYHEDEYGQNAKIIADDFKTQHCNRVVFLVHNFGLLPTARMLMRYESLGSGNFQWGDPITAHNALYNEAGVRFEGFASPLNSKLLGKEGAHFCSLFFDTDEHFGSLGDFFSVDFSKKPGGWTVNPPFIEPLIERVANKIIDYVRSSEESKSNWFFISSPRWTDTLGYKLYDESEYKLDRIDLCSGEFTVQCPYGSVFPPENDLTVFIIGRQLPNNARMDKIKRIFRDLDTEYIKQEWLQNCQININDN